MRRSDRNRLLGILIGIIAVIFIFLIFFNLKPQSQKLTENDFKIMSISWNDYWTELKDGEYAYSNNKINWTDACYLNNLANGKEPSPYTGEPYPIQDRKQIKNNLDVYLDEYTITTQQKKDLYCYFVIGGINYLKEGYPNKIFKAGIDVKKDVFYRLTAIDKDNQIVICCSLENIRSSEMRGEDVCQSAILPAKCK